MMPAEALDLVSLTVPAAALEAFEAALSSVCRAVSFFHDEANDAWVVEGVKERGVGEGELVAALAVAELLTGYAPAVQRSLTPAGGWLARNQMAFPEQLIGRRFAVRGTHIKDKKRPGRITLVLDAGLAFGSGEHNSTRGCLMALEWVARRRRACRMLDLGAGSGILAIAAARLWRRRVLATDIDPRAVRVAAGNARGNGVGRYVRAVRADGWMGRRIRSGAPYELVFANILARPLCAMAAELGAQLTPGGTAILAGLLDSQWRWVLAAHRRAGLRLERRIMDGVWAILVLRK